MLDPALFISMVALFVVGLSFAIGLILAVVGVFRDDTSFIFEAIMFATAIVALICAMSFD